MPAYLFIGILLLLAVVGLMKLFAGANPASLAQGLRWAAFALAGIGLVLLPFLGRGSLAILGPAVLVPLLMRFWRWSQAGSGHSRPSPGQTSSVGTAWLAMTLDHDSGHMEGTVRRGRFASRSLSALTLAELRALLDECRAADPDSVALLEAYLERTHPDWRDEKAPGAGERGESHDAGQAPPRGGMTREEAYQILGLEAGAGPAAIREAHRRLMQKLHPDHGGSTYLAAKLNQAKDLLLRN
jgi:hypothetical protein